jgi:hypothetical protein
MQYRKQDVMLSLAFGVFAVVLLAVPAAAAAQMVLNKRQEATGTGTGTALQQQEQRAGIVAGEQPVAPAGTRIAGAMP